MESLWDESTKVTVSGGVLLLQLWAFWMFLCGSGGVFTLMVFDFCMGGKKVLVLGNELEMKMLNSQKLLLRNFTKWLVC